ncbi:hypothetical protein SEA_DEXDERT_61 [Gordonia phage Dexdert]|uniref:Uncharacterized protein n=1 Tax=Gordonia phage Dexdert TaxID=2794946 RepID=A0A7T1NXP0_9CAUD|nr:hypothetical protein J1597_gp61 [Gordonia phage Dexdert]QPO17057.1 hypothetical protein SEA_DEXDERT_61 [Gordonia phage Dexdert]
MMTTLYQHPDTGHLASYSPRAGSDDPNPWVEYACTPFAFSAVARHPELPDGYLALVLVPEPAVGTILDGLIDAVPSSAPGGWAEQIDEQRKRADAAEAERDELADALRDLDRHITNVTRSMLDK